MTVPAGIEQTIARTTGLGQYASGLLDSLGSMTNWAANLASGGNAGNIPSFGSTAIQAGPTVSFGGNNPYGWTTSFDPATGLITYTNERGQGQQFTETINNYGGPGSNVYAPTFGNMPQSVMDKWWNDYHAHQRGQSAGQASGATGNQNDMGPFLSTAWNAIQQQAGLPARMAPVEQQTTALANEAQAEGQTLMTEATTGTGLFPSQQAYVEQAKQQGETESAAMLAKLGLSESTMGPQLKEQADLAAASTAGQLIQGNISLAQASQKIALGAQALETSEQQAVFDMYSQIASESTAFQRNLWDEAMQGYGTLGQLVSTSAQSYGYSLSGYQSVVSGLEANAQNQTALDEAAMKADSQGTSSMFGALGSILGGSGGGSGGSGGSSSIGSIIGAVVGIVASFL